MRSKRELVSAEMGGVEERFRLARSQAEAVVGRETLLVLVLELLNEVVGESVVEVSITQVRVTGGGPDLEGAPLLVKRETSKVPPSRSKMRTLRSLTAFLLRP